MITFFCVGTDRGCGDALGPLVGTYLQKLGYNVIGTLDNTVNALNLDERIKEIPEGSYVIAIDSCLGLPTSIGRIDCNPGPLKPGAGVGKVLTPVGDEHIAGIVNVGGFMEAMILAATPLSRVMKMADEIVCIIQDKYPINEAAAAKEELPYD